MDILSAVFFICQLNASDLLELYKEDQAVRSQLKLLSHKEVKKYIIEVMLPGDKIRLSKVQGLLNTSENLSSEEYFAAAMIMQHGSEPKHYKMAMELSRKSATLNQNYKSAHWLSFAAEDRYHLKMGKP